MDVVYEFLLIVGDTTADAALYQCWTRIYGESSAAWLSEAAARNIAHDNPGEVALPLLQELLTDVPGIRVGQSWLTSHRVELEVLELVRERLGLNLADHLRRLGADARANSLKVARPEEIEVPDAPRDWVVTPEAFQTATTIPFTGDRAQTPVRSRVPAVLAEGLAGLRLGNWVADIAIGGCRLPRRRDAVNAADSGSAARESGDIRCGRTGTSWVGRNTFDLPPRVNIEHSLNAPTLRDPNMPRLLDALIAPGWTWQLSSCGVFYEGFTAMVGSIAELVKLLRDPVQHSILRAFVDSDLGRKLHDRRYLRVEDLAPAALGAMSPAARLFLGHRAH